MLQHLGEVEGNQVGAVAAVLGYDLCVLFRAAMLSSPETKLAASDCSPGSSSTSMRWGLPCMSAAEAVATGEQNGCERRTD